MWFSIDTLEYLRRGGRIGGAQAWLGTTLKIKPILTVEAQITPVERVRTSRRASSEWSTCSASAPPRAPTPTWSSTSGAERGRGADGAGPRSSAPTRCVLGDRPGDRRARRPGAARRRRDAELAALRPSPACRAMLSCGALERSRRRRPRPNRSALIAAMPPPSTNPATPGADDHLLLVVAELRAPVGQPHDLTAQLFQRRSELCAVLLDRRPDLLGRCGHRRHQARPIGGLRALHRLADLLGLVDRHLGRRARRP